MDPWQKENLNLQIGDCIIWQDVTLAMEDQPAVVTPGMKGKVLSLHDGFHLDVVQCEPIPPRAIVQFDNGITLMVDQQTKWERITGAG